MTRERTRRTIRALTRRAAARAVPAAMALMLAASQAGAAEAERVFGWISIRPVEGSADQIEIQAHASALDAVEASYELSLDKGREGNRSRTMQRGALKLEPFEQADLSRTVINIAPGDSVEVGLAILVDGEEVFTVRAGAPGP